VAVERRHQGVRVLLQQRLEVCEQRAVLVAEVEERESLPGIRIGLQRNPPASIAILFL
jgi:hypothetical protein